MLYGFLQSAFHSFTERKVYQSFKEFTSNRSFVSYTKKCVSFLVAFFCLCWMKKLTQIQAILLNIARKISAIKEATKDDLKASLWLAAPIDICKDYWKWMMKLLKDMQLSKKKFFFLFKKALSHHVLTLIAASTLTFPFWFFNWFRISFQRPVFLSFSSYSKLIVT